MSPTEYDVLVVGAGPGGAVSSYYAAEEGLSTAIFDDKKIIGVPVKCGEYLPVRAEMEYLTPRGGETLQLWEVPKDVISNVCETIDFVSPKGRKFTFPFKANIVNREHLQQHYVEEAVAKGATLNQKVKVQLQPHNSHPSIRLSTGEIIRGKILIVSDGFPSRIGEAAGLNYTAYKSPMNYAINLQYLMDNIDIDPSVTEMYMGTKYAPGGYAWIIPKGDRIANVGTGIRTPYVPGRENVKIYMDAFMKHHPAVADRLKNGRILQVVGDVLPVDGPIPQTYNEYAMAIGDAAGMVMPTNGGGIAPAMMTGMIAARIAKSHIDADTPLALYETRWKEALGKELTVSTRIRRMSDWFMKHDQLFHLLLRYLGTNGIREVITCRVPGRARPFIW